MGLEKKMNDLRNAAQQALEALESDWYYRQAQAITALRAALARPEQEPVAVTREMVEQLYALSQCPFMDCKKALVMANGDIDRACEILRLGIHRAPPQRKPLTDMAIERAYDELLSQPMREQDKRVIVNFARAIEAAHGIGGQP
jgi:hypothetical protein